METYSLSNSFPRIKKQKNEKFVIGINWFIALMLCLSDSFQASCGKETIESLQYQDYPGSWRKFACGPYFWLHFKQNS